jgi:3-methyladenine DNA glycosylase AlkD
MTTESCNQFNRDEADSLLARLNQHASEANRAQMTRTAPTALVIHGVRMPILRKIAREWRREHSETAFADVVGVAEGLWGGESLEERVMAMLLLEEFRRGVPGLTAAHFDRWRVGIDNWVVGDNLAWLLALWVVGDLGHRTDYLWGLIADEDVWSRRLAVAATVRLNRESDDPSLPDLTLALVDRVRAERHPMVTKAVSWALRELTKAHREALVAYLDANRDVLASHVVREVENKLRTGLKSGKT